MTPGNLEVLGGNRESPRREEARPKVGAFSRKSRDQELSCNKITYPEKPSLGDFQFNQRGVIIRDFFIAQEV
jgi:hypothetical protein